MTWIEVTIDALTFLEREIRVYRLAHFPIIKNNPTKPKPCQAIAPIILATDETVSSQTKVTQLTDMIDAIESTRF